MLSWVKFIICGIAIIWCGYKLSFLGDVICEKTKITRTIMGFAILSVATSAPEFVTSIASVVVIKIPDFAAGGVFGSIILNLGIIAVLDLVEGKGPIMFKVHAKQILYAGWSIIFLSVVVFSMLLRIVAGISPVFWGLGWESFILPILLVVALISIFNLEKATEKRNQQDIAVSSVKKKYQQATFRYTLFKFIFYLLAIIGLGMWLSQIGKEIVTVMGWSEILVGTFFLAMVTSFPELIVSISALKFDINMAVGNILGSNFFDVMIIPICDVLLKGKTFLSLIRTENIFTAMLAIILLTIVIVGLTSRSKRSFMKLGWDAIAIVLVLVGGSSVLFFLVR